MNIIIKAFSALTFSALAGCAGKPPSDNVFLNLSFEHGTPRGYPLAWYIEADAGSASVNIDPQRSSDGKYSLRVRNAGAEPVVLYTPLLAGPHCLEATNAQASVLPGDSEIEVSLFYLSPGDPLMLGESAQTAIEEWSTFGVSLASEDGCLSPDLMLGIFVQGQGEAWIDGVRLTTNNSGYSLSETPPRAVPSRQMSDIIARHAIELDTLEPSADLHDLETLDALFNVARIVGLGENSHGARALFQLKHRIVRLLVEQAGFTIFALEMPAEQAKVVNDYLLGRDHDKRAALLALTYPSWQSEEMWVVIEWLRAHNRNTVTPVTFHGLDTPPGDGSEDQRMADEAARIMNGAAADGKMIIWADNTHVSKHGRAMGARLAERHGNAYVAVGTTFNEGHYLAYGQAQRYEVHPGYPGTHEHLLAQTDAESFVLGLAALPPGHALREVRGFRYIGSTPQDLHQFFPHRLDEHFDIIGFTRRTDSIRLIVEHDF